MEMMCIQLIILDTLKQKYEDKEAEMKADFATKIKEIKKKSADDFSACKAELIAKLKKDYGKMFINFNKIAKKIKITALFFMNSQNRCKL